jgi:CRISPR-associated protein Csb1
MSLKETPVPDRQHLDVRMQPLSGSRFQPTGFPDVGAALFQRPIGDSGWQDCLLLESAQSMANHLEATAWDDGAQEPVSAFAGLPYVRVVAEDGRYLTSSRTEPHRLAAGFIKDSKVASADMRQVIRDRLDLQDDTPLDLRQVARAVLALDPMCLVHGVFFAENAKIWPGQPRVARALTSFVEAHDVRSAISGGVKRDDVRHSVADTGGAAEGYGFVPFHRTEYVAREIVASFALDLDQLASYGLPEPAGQLLATAARWEIRRLLDGGFRPRTACDLAVVDPADVDLPSLDALTSQLADLVRQCGELLGEGGPLVVTWDGGKARPKKASA